MRFKDFSTMKYDDIQEGRLEVGDIFVCRGYEFNLMFSCRTYAVGKYFGDRVTTICECRTLKNAKMVAEALTRPVHDDPLPCPFCGLSPTIRNYDAASGVTLYSVGCNVCRVAPYTVGYPSRESAIREWNARA